MLQMSHMKLYDMINHVGGELVQIKTDCIVVRNPDLSKLDFVNDVKLEDPPLQYFERVKPPRTDKYSLNVKKWDVQNDNAKLILDYIKDGTGCCLDGMAGYRTIFK